MRRLIVMRHAKSSWDDPELADFDRPLNKRGRRSAGLVGGWLRRRGYLPEAALVSAAARTRETWAGVAAEIGEVPARLDRALYEAHPATILQSLRRAPADARTLLLLGHMPGIGAFAADLLADGAPEGDFARYPTGATAVIDLPCATWADADWRTGRLVDFTVPRALE